MSEAKPNYARISVTYDRARNWQNIPADEALADLVAARSNEPAPASGLAATADSLGAVRVLEVGCGSGNYLLAQRAAFGVAVSLAGLDPSPDMLDLARGKLPEAELRQGRAENLPFNDAAFEFVIFRASFHQVEDKALALREAARVLRPGGTLRIWGGHAESRPDWWVYRFFPSTRAADQARFWTADEYFTGLTAAGFEPELSISYRRELVPVAELIRRAELRDLSQLSLIPELEYQAGLEGLRKITQNKIASGSAVVDARAQKQEG